MVSVMTAGDTPRGPLSHVAARHATVALALVCLALVVALVMARLVAHPAALAGSLGDTDDAARLVQLRAFLAHGDWWDLTLPAMGAPEPLLSHWSRLIDLGLALILAGAGLILAPADAELAMRIVWPSLMLLALMLLVAREAAREGGPVAGYCAAGLAALSVAALYQFQPGRIDHHNVQILCAVGGILLLARALQEPRVGWWAGALLGLGLVIGLESTSLVAPALVLAVLTSLGRQGGLAGVSRVAAAMAATLAVGVLTATPPGRLGVMVCDAAALNLVAVSVMGAVGVLAAAALEPRLAGRRRVVAQLGALAVAGSIGLAAYAALEPACLGGPFGQVTRDLWPIWLSQVTEGQPVSYLLARDPAPTAGLLLFIAIGIAARTHFMLLARAALRDRAAAGHIRTDAHFREKLLLGVQVMALVATACMVKMMPYAAWLAVPAVARLVVNLPSLGSASALTTRLAAFLLLSESTLSSLAGGTIGLVAKPGADLAPLARTGCSATRLVSALAPLEPGLVLGDINIGPYVAALTPHRVVMAPYHRLDRGIIDGHRALAASPDAAEALLRRLGVTYVLACRPTDPMPTEVSRSDGATVDASARPNLADALRAGRPPAYLAPVAVPDAAPLHVWRLRPEASAAASEPPPAASLAKSR